MHRTTSAARSLRRGEPWKAILQLDELRRFALELACMEKLDGASVDSLADSLPDSVKALFSETVPAAADVASVHRSLARSVEILLDHADALDRRFGLGTAAEVRSLLDAHLGPVPDIEDSPGRNPERADGKF